MGGDNNPALRITIVLERITEDNSGTNDTAIVSSSVRNFTEQLVLIYDLSVLMMTGMIDNY